LQPLVQLRAHAGAADALKQLKFSELLPPAMAEATLSSRADDPVGCHATAGTSLVAGVRPPG